MLRKLGILIASGILLSALPGLAQEIDLLEKAAQARWSNRDGDRLTFGRDHKEQGLVRYESGATLEDGQRYERVLFIHPPWKSGGAVYGAFDDLAIPANDPKLVFTAGFNQGAAGTDGVSIGIRFLHGGTREGAAERRVRASSQLGSPSQTIYTLEVRYDRKLARGECSLERFAGQTGTLMLVLNAGSSADKDWAVLTELKLLSGPSAAEKQKERALNLTGHTGRLYGIRFSPDGNLIVTASADRTARIWAFPSGKLRTTLRGHAGIVFAADFSPNSRRVVTAGGDSTARIWQAGSGNLLQVLAGHTEAVLAAAFSPDGSLVATGSDDGTVRIWQASNGKELRSIAVASDGVYALAFHPQGRFLAVGGTNGGLSLWRVNSGQRIREFGGHTRAVSTVTFNHTGIRLVSASVDNTVIVWNTDSGKHVQDFGGQPFHAAAFSPNGRHIVTGVDGRGLIWDIKEGKRVMTLRHASGDAVRSVAFHKSGRYVALAGEDGSARIFEVELE
jgi:WD40 repeat protein